MKTLLWSCCVLALAFTACTTKSKAKATAESAFIAGQRAADARATQNQTPRVTVVGEIRNPTIVWYEGLTLARAIVAADYRGFRDPRAILVTRDGVGVEVNVKKLLRGEEDPPLLPGDVVELIR